MQEYEYKLCKICNKIKKRLMVGRYNHKDKKWADEEGGLWNGRSCGVCNKDRVKKAMQKTRAEKNS